MHGDTEIAELELREMTGKDIIDVGFPYLIGVDGGGELKIQASVIVKYVSRLAAVPPSVVEKLSPSDITGLTGVVMGFFGQSAGA
jgi:hypothetical protein